MTLSDYKTGRERISAMIGVALVHGAILWALLAGLNVRIAAPVSDSLKLFDISAPPAPPVEQQEMTGTSAAKEPPAAPNVRADPSPVVAPPPEIRLDNPSPVAAAPIAGNGVAVSAGASDRSGPGTGAGGGTGAGTGGGTGAGVAIPARQIAGRITDRDYPAAARRARIEGRVLVRFAVDSSGRANACIVLRSSGNTDLDAATCRLIERRFRFAPARDAAGRAMADTKVWEQIWWLALRKPGP